MRQTGNNSKKSPIFESIFVVLFKCVLIKRNIVFNTYLYKHTFRAVESECGPRGISLHRGPVSNQFLH